MEIEIRNILQGINPYVEITDETKLLEEEILDSMGILLLITEIEQSFNVGIQLDDLQMEVFEDISSIVQFIKKICKDEE